MLSRSSIVVLSVLLVLVAGTVVAPVIRAKDEKLKPEQLLAKHLDSIGTADRLKEIKSRSTGGTVQVIFRGGSQGTLNGKASIWSDGNLARAGFTFPALDYSGEQLAFDGNKVSVGQLSPGRRSPLSTFVYENDVLLKEGLMFGSLATSWALLDSAGKQPKLDLSGPKKIDGRMLYEMKYEPRKGKGNVKAWLYFDPETFRHVRSQFKVEIPASAATKITDSAELERYQIIEQFDQFKEVDGLTLPRSYKLEFTIDSPRGTVLHTWTYVIEQVVHNQPIDREVFSVQ